MRSEFAGIFEAGVTDVDDHGQTLIGGLHPFGGNGQTLLQGQGKPLTGRATHEGGAHAVCSKETSVGRDGVEIDRAVGVEGREGSGDEAAESVLHRK